MSKIAGELNAEMSGAINSSTYQAWLNSPLTKALKRSFEQSITDPENQPSQYGTVTLEYMQKEIDAMIAKAGEVMRERAVIECGELANCEDNSTKYRAGASFCQERIRALPGVTLQDLQNKSDGLKK